MGREREREREELYITVPSLFRCPISLDLMKSPVSLCTGVTYDRSSIKRWLDGGNNTCPATMQVLHTTDLVPNRNLQRLIQIWSDSVARRRIDALLPSPEQVRTLVKDLEARRDASVLARIASFARESEQNRRFVAGIDGFLDLLVDLLGGNADEKLLEQVVTVLDLILGHFEDASLLLKRNRDCLSPILVVMRRGSAEARTAAARVLESIAIDAESKLLIAEKEGLLPELLKLIDIANDPSVVEAALSCLVAISAPKRTRIRLVRLRITKSLTKLLSAEANSSVSVTEKALKLLEVASACKEGRAEISENAECVPAIVQKVLKVSAAATEHAVTVLWSVCYLFRDQRAQEAVAKSNGLTKILVLMQSNCSPPVRQMLGDLLKIFRVSSKPCLSTYETKNTLITPF